MVGEITASFKYCSWQRCTVQKEVSVEGSKLELKTRRGPVSWGNLCRHILSLSIEHFFGISLVVIVFCSYRNHFETPE